MYRQSIQFPIKDSALREDVHALGALIGETLRDQGGEEFFKLVEGDRLAAIRPPEGDGAGGAAVAQAPTNRSPVAADELTRAVPGSVRGEPPAGERRGRPRGASAS